MKRWQLRRTAPALLALMAVGSCTDGTGPSYPELVITTMALADAMQDQPYREGINADGGDEEYQWQVVSGELPEGLALSVEDLTDDDVLLTGTPDEDGTFSFTVRVESGDGQSATTELTLEVLPPDDPFVIATPFLPPALAEAPYDVTLRASGGESFTWQLVDGSLPPGLSLDGSSIEGTPTEVGTSTLTVRVTSDEERREATFTLEVVANRPGTYDITTAEVSPVPVAIRPFLEDAISEWEAAISGDLQGGLIGPDFFPAGSCAGYGQAVNGTVVEDVLIVVDISPIDGPGEVLGQAGPCALRNETLLPVVGVLTLDSDDLAQLTSPDAGETLMAIISHEIGHVLGFGSLWEDLELVTGTGGPDAVFTGAEAVQEWRDLGGSGEVPLEVSGGEGTADVHWSEVEFGDERMTGFAEAPGVEQPLSRVSIAAMADLGYEVDYDAADPYVLPSLLAREIRSDLGYDVVLTGPYRVARPDGTSFLLRRR